MSGDIWRNPPERRRSMNWILKLDFRFRFQTRPYLLVLFVNVFGFEKAQLGPI